MRRGAVWWSLTVVLTLALLGTLGFGAWQLFIRPAPVAPADSAQARQVVIDVAKSSTTKLLSYGPDDIESELSDKAKLLTGDFHDYYVRFTREIVIPSTKSKSVTTTATVPAAAVESLSADTATLIVFVNQTTTSKEKPDPSNSASTVRVTLQKVNGDWLIAKFDPI